MLSTTCKRIIHLFKSINTYYSCFSIQLQKYIIKKKLNTLTIHLTQHVSCNLIGHSGPEIYLGSRPSSQARDSSSLPLPPNLMGAIKYPSTCARDSSSLPMYYSGCTEGIGGVGVGGKCSPTPAGGSAGLSFHLNPTTLAMLQQHNYIPYFRGIKAREAKTWSNTDNGQLALLLSNRNRNCWPFQVFPKS